MIEQIGDLWEAHKDGNWVAVTTNGDLRKDGENVMGKGIALQAKQRFPDLPKRIGAGIAANGNHVQVFEDIKVISFPTKYSWRYHSSLLLIKQSAEELSQLDLLGQVYMPRPGCGEGRLYWPDVRPIIKPILDDRFVILNLK